MHDDPTTLVLALFLSALACGPVPLDEQDEQQLSLTTTAGRTFFVAPNGSDTRSVEQAQNVGSPWKTISKAAREMKAGDTVQVRAGTYGERIVPAQSGNATAGYITFMAYPGETATITGNGTLSRPAPAVWDAPFHISNRNYIRVVGFNIANSDGCGVFIQNSQFIEVKKNSISNTQVSGVFAMTSSDISVVANDVGFTNISMKQEAISLSSVVRFSIAYNVVHDGYKEGIDVKVASSQGEIRGNRVSRMAWAGIYLDGFGANQSDIDVHGNIVVDSQTSSTGGSGDGIRLGNEGGGRASRIRIFNHRLQHWRKRRWNPPGQ